MTIRGRSSWIGVALSVGAAAVSVLAMAATPFPSGSYESEGYTITFEKTGSFHYVKGERLMVDGEFVVKADEIVLTDETGVDACVGPGRNPGRYRWRVDAGSLSFATIHDSCNDRVRGITGQKWTRKRDRSRVAQ